MSEVRMRGRHLVVLVAFCVLAACSPRDTAQRAAPISGAEIQPIYVVTQRALNNTGPTFGQQRQQGLRFFRADISIPPNHVPGRIEWPKKKKLDPAEHFAVTKTEVYRGQAAMVRAVHRQGGGKETLVFVHGYNNTLSEAMYRLAQIQTDFKTDRPAVLVSWPSAGDARGYVYDRDSILYARDDMEATLRGLTAAPGEKVFLLAHSMGAHLTMEVLRQAALRGDRRLLSRISGVVLMSPDIDPDVFRKQAETIGRLPQPFMIFISREDRALTLAGLLTGSKPRLGVIDSPEHVDGLNVTVLDFTELGDGEGYNHFVPVTSPAAVKVLQDMISQSGAPQNAGFLVLKPQT